MNDTGTLIEQGDVRWRAALDVVSHDIYHDPEYCRLDAELWNGRAVAFHYRIDDQVLLAPLTLRRIPGTDAVDAASPYGYSGPVSNATGDSREFWADALRAMMTALRRVDVVTVFARLHPLFPTADEPLAEAGAVVDHGETVSVDLTLPLEEIRQRTRKDHRKHIRQARAAGWRVVVDDWLYYDGFIAVYYENMRRVGATDYYLFSRQHFTNLRKRLDGRVHLAAVLDGDEVVAAHLFFHHDGIVQNYLSGTRGTHVREHLDKLLYDEVRCWAKAAGAVTHHLGGGRGGGSDSLFEYKAGFSDRRHRFSTWRAVVDAEVNAALVDAHAAGADHGCLTGSFPVYRFGRSGED